MSVSEHRAVDRTALTTQLAKFIETSLMHALDARGHASLVVSGGSTPQALFADLSRCALAWDKITVTLADERWVDPTSRDSNEAMLRRTLLQNYASKATFIALKNSAPTALEGEQMANQAISKLERPFDLIILGMGEDGHTASLFPAVAGRALLRDSPELCLSVTPLHAPHERMTLTAGAILNSRNIILHITGNKKWQVYQNALEQGPVDELPVRVILHQNQTPVFVYWSP